MLETSEQFTEIAAALASAEAEFKPIEKDSEAEIQGEAKGSGREFRFTFEYASLASVLEAVRPALAKHGIAILQPAQHKNEQGAVVVSVQTWLVHKSGQWFRSPVSAFITAAGDPKKVGIAMTYARRYQISALLGVAAEEDKDADGTGQRKETVRRAPPASATGRSAPPPRERAAESGGDSAPMTGGSEDVARPDPATVIRAAIAQSDWKTALPAITALGGGPLKEQLKQEYQAARYGGTNGKGAHS